jgi:hypothetical protein
LLTIGIAKLKDEFFDLVGFLRAVISSEEEHFVRALMLLEQAEGVDSDNEVGDRLQSLVLSEDATNFLALFVSEQLEFTGASLLPLGVPPSVDSGSLLVNQLLFFFTSFDVDFG